MSRDLIPDTIQSISQDVVRPFFAVELKFDGENTLRMWTGQGTLILADGTEWVGAGDLLNISTIEETSEMAVKGATVTLNGIPSNVISLALGQPYQGRVCNIYFGAFTVSDGSLLQEDSSYILLEDGSKIILQGSSNQFNEIFSGYMDQMNIQEESETSSVELTVENKLVDLERARVARFTSGYQKSLYENDHGFDFVESMQDKQVSWGRKSGN
tara:strand:+ start:423 stop:1064 length:642 start_codon:yes stop_codon:yes gene_type:complete